MPAPTRTSDLEQRIAAELDAGDLDGAATAIVRGYGPVVLGYLANLLHDEEVARDVFGQCCENLWRGLAGFRRECSARTWFFRVAWTAFADHRRGAARHPALPVSTSELARAAGEVRSSTIRRNRAMDQLARLREQLEPLEQSMLSLRLDQRMSWQEVAVVMSEGGELVEEATLRKRYDRLKDKLRRLAVAEGLIEPG